ncbi:hypothetical protein AA313_de0206043 [Arthrobotrys entomopaga]|nr:hypothetical protein AA313_de0206043 [Arthrobotrys entomopaga]
MVRTFLPQTWRRGLSRAYIPLKNSSDASTADEEVGHPTNNPSRTTSATKFLRLPPARTLLVLLCLVTELLIGYAIGWWHGTTTYNPQSRMLDRELCRSDPEVQKQFRSDDYFFHAATSESHLPAVPPYNVISSSENTVLAELEAAQSPVTPLFIPFTRNHKMLEQTVLSYIAAGWPRSDIIVVENTGTMDANPKGLLTAKNPFYLDYSLLRKRYGVSILRTPTLLSFAQVQNFMISTAMSKGWAYYYWSHQDVAVMSNETAVPFKSFYENVVDSLAALKGTMGPEAGKDRWAGRFYAFDWLTLINVDALVNVGAWDTFIPYYSTDCDWYERARLAGFSVDDDTAGLIYDLNVHVDDPEERFFGEVGENERVNSTRFQELSKELEDIQARKLDPDFERNSWQTEMNGGKGEPWTYDPDGFQRAWWLMADAGRMIYRKKWNTKECSLRRDGKKLKDIWGPPPPPPSE